MSYLIIPPSIHFYSVIWPSIKTYDDATQWLDVFQEVSRSIKKIMDLHTAKNLHHPNAFRDLEKSFELIQFYEIELMSWEPKKVSQERSV